MDNLQAKILLPPGSADGNWCLIDGDSDNGDVVAIIDPDAIFDELGHDPGNMAELLAAAPKMLVALRQAKEMIRGLCHQASDLVEATGDESINDVWNEGGYGYETSRVVDDAIAAAGGHATTSGTAVSGFQIGHHAQEHPQQPVEIDPGDGSGLLLKLPHAGWEILLELNDDGKPVLLTYRPDSQDEPIQTLVLSEGDRDN